MIEFNPLAMSDLAALSPDLVIGNWAGGFNDPAGFLSLLRPLLGRSFESYLLAHGLDLENALLESDADARAKKFRDLSRAVVEKGLLIPGWRSRTYYVAKKGIDRAHSASRYTPRLSEIRLNR